MMQTSPLFFLLRRSIHLGGITKSAAKTDLAKLRKKTGFTFLNCKKALKEFNNDIVKAEEWLHKQAEKEGWSKATSLQGRETAQGLVAVLCQDNYATMVEVNCETDFVARNSQFQQFVGKVASMALKQHRSENSVINDVGKVELMGDKLDGLKSEQDDGSSVKDITALTIGKIGENITVKRAVCMHVPVGHILGSYVHSMAKTSILKTNDCSLGKYGALVAAHSIKKSSAKMQPDEFGRRLCQHIVGMKPVRIGEFVPPVQKESEEQEDGEEIEEQIVTDLVNQEYLIDPSLTVGELLYQEGIQVIDFVRYECGQKLH
ncbi:elongation factor Ts, mitochondrial-like isoform X2 [Anneissia japonica]|uniref:elongation factor Ts, mitochondrial-like isoform X2 n=1 Tax=Anneissia japonica TaxID=1529436 RepID=UPI001425AE2D|nr:elongation factor Ts, mitochondrial-like isoform X2 [Anneissia japonica]